MKENDAYEENKLGRIKKNIVLLFISGIMPTGTLASCLPTETLAVLGHLCLLHPGIYLSIYLGRFPQFEG